MSFGRATITFALLRRKSALPESHFVGTKHFAFDQKFHDMVFFEDQDGIGSLSFLK